MLAQLNSHFPHRHNRDGSHDSICTKCFLTIASVREESELVQFEIDHVCDPVLFYQFSQGDSSHCSFRNTFFLAA